MKKYMIATTTAFIVMILVIVLLNTLEKKEDQFLKAYGLNTMNIVEIINHLEHKIDEPTGFYASISGSSLYLGDEQNEQIIALPSDMFYLSIAPYINQTHSCSNHNLVTCTGELKSESFQISIKDIETTHIIFDHVVQSSLKGFAGIWLPRNKNIEITVNYQGMEAKTHVSTLSSSPTCLTTLKLS